VGESFEVPENRTCRICADDNRAVHNGRSGGGEIGFSLRDLVCVVDDAQQMELGADRSGQACGHGQRAFGELRPVERDHDHLDRRENLRACGCRFGRAEWSIAHPDQASTRSRAPLTPLAAAQLAQQNIRLLASTPWPIMRHPQCVHKGASAWTAHSKLSNKWCSLAKITSKLLS
jgi:hypothetical protein